MRIARVFLEVDMRNAFQGLLKILTKNNIDSRVLGKGDLIVFLNRKTTAFKVLSGNSYLVYYNNKNQKIPLEALQYLPGHFGGSPFQFSKEVERVIKDKLVMKGIVVNPRQAR